VDTDLKIDLPQATVVIDRDQVADLGLDLATVARELGTLLGGGYVNRFNWFDRSYKVIPQIGEKDRATVAPLLDLKIKRRRRTGAGLHLHEDRTPAPRTSTGSGQRNAVRIWRAPRRSRDEGRRLERPLLLYPWHTGVDPGESPDPP
jgi:multidrug efflux pump